MPDRGGRPERSGEEAADYPTLAAAGVNSLTELDARLVGCRACPRLVAWREEVAATRRKSFQDWDYWGRPVPGFGPADAPMLIMGLAPAAHGANRTGRMFTGDRSGDVLFAAMYDVGLASQPTARSIDDGLQLRGVRITAGVHCAPPDNKPAPDERRRCLSWLQREVELTRPHVRSVVVLGHFGWTALLPVLRSVGWQVPRPLPKFGHGVEYEFADSDDGGNSRLAVFGCYHVSQQNTFTGRLTPAMLRDVLAAAAASAGL